MTRSSGRKPTPPPGAERKPASRPAPRKQRPPDKTHAEESYYRKQMTAKTAMIVVLQDGEEVAGSIEWYDKSAIKLGRDGEPSLLIPKHQIRYLFKEKERRHQRRRADRDRR